MIKRKKFLPDVKRIFYILIMLLHKIHFCFLYK